MEYNKKNYKELNEYFKNKYQDERLLVFHLDILSKAAFNFSFYDTYVTNEEMENVFKFYNFDDFSKTKDLYFYLGTTREFHLIAPNPFIIIGTFHPKKDAQLSLF